MKVRISHFIAKGIPINEVTKPVPAKIAASQSKSKDTKKAKEVVATPKKRVSPREWIKSEIKYASTPVKQTSKLLEFVIRRDAAEFREVTNQSKKRCNGKIKNC